MTSRPCRLTQNKESTKGGTIPPPFFLQITIPGEGRGATLC